jgi:hypothetical protein
MCTIRRIIRQQCIPTKLPVSPDAVSHHIVYYQQNTTSGCAVDGRSTVLAGICLVGIGSSI